MAGKMIHIHDLNYKAHVPAPTIAGKRLKKGLVPRDYTVQPLYSGAAARPDFPLIPQSEWSERIRDKDRAKSWLRNMRDRGNGGRRIPSRDQNGRGYCWMHSGVSAMLLVRARDNQPYADLSAYGPACIIKNFRDQGGWGAQGVDFLVERGCPTSKTWPQQGTSRSYDKPETWEEAARYKAVEGWWDLDQPQYDRNLTWQQVVTLLLSNVPVIMDFNWWAHSVCGCFLIDGLSRRSNTRDEVSGKLADLTRFEKIWGINDPVMAGVGSGIWNSWGDGWSDAGMGELSGSRAVPNGSVAIRTALAA